jgi:hypothetical protein
MNGLHYLIEDDTGNIYDGNGNEAMGAVDGKGDYAVVKQIINLEMYLEKKNCE